MLTVCLSSLRYHIGFTRELGLSFRAILEEIFRLKWGSDSGLRQKIHLSFQANCGNVSWYLWNKLKLWNLFSNYYRIFLEKLHRISWTLSHGVVFWRCKLIQCWSIWHYWIRYLWLQFFIFHSYSLLELFQLCFRRCFRIRFLFCFLWVYCFVRTMDVFCEWLMVVFCVITRYD